MIADMINSVGEFGGAGMIALNIWRLHKDKAVRGVHWLSVAFFAIWGYWNLYYYPSLDQWWSFSGSVAMATLNTVWVCQMLYYINREK